MDDDEDDSDSDDGLLMAKSKKTVPFSRDIMARRRDTNTSTESTDTAKKVVVHND